MTTALHHLDHGTGTPLVFLHGFTVDHRLLLPLEDAFSERDGWWRLHLDLPGHGRSPASSSRPSADAIGDTVAAAVDDLIGAGTGYAVCGVSFGGQVARQLLARHTERVLGLALLAPVVRPRPDRRIDPGALPIDTSDPAYLRHAAPGIAAHDEEFAARLLTDYDPSTPPESSFGRFDKPALVITGRQDDSVGYRDQFELLDAYPQMTYAALDGARHNVHLDQPAITRALFLDWLDRMAQRAER